jgi:hypothetical protein
MSGPRGTGLSLIVALSAVAAAAHAQPPGASEPNATLLARADSITVGDYCRVAQRVLASPGVMPVLASDSSTARLSAITICDPFLSSFSLLALSGRASAPVAAVARARTGGSSTGRQAIFAAMSEFMATVRGEDVREAIRDSIGVELNSELIRVSTTAQSLLLTAARDRALDRIARYERKLGPTSPRLNGPEVLLNYAAQRWVPGFRPTQLGGPSPLELVASYTPGYLPLGNGTLQAASASEFGLRYYFFGERFGGPGWRGVLLPTYWSIGALTVSDRNGALVWPWEGRDRTGVYVSWGSIKVGYVNGREAGEWLASKQFQAIPYVF